MRERVGYSFRRGPKTRHAASDSGVFRRIILSETKTEEPWLCTDTGWHNDVRRESQEEHDRIHEAKHMENEESATNGTGIRLPGISVPDIVISGTGSTVLPDDPGMPDQEENAELEWGRRNIPADPVPRFVERKTEITGCGIRIKKRSHILTNEMLIQKRIIPLLDRMQAELLRQIGSLDQRIGRLETKVDGLEKWRWS
ncbi:MAG: hypothetical protein M0Q92_01780 [Methanoregula sp.]|nr:hypothetical protein [Methanoregula sp.]